MQDTRTFETWERINDAISRVRHNKDETGVNETAADIVRLFGLDYFIFGILCRTGKRERYRCLIGCAPEWCFLYNQNKWHLIDPFIHYSLNNTAPVLSTNVPLFSEGQRRMMELAGQHGFKSGVVVPVHSGSSARIGILYLGTDSEHRAKIAYGNYRHLMRAFGLELIEWWNTRLQATSSEELHIDNIDLQLLAKAAEDINVEEVARELGLTLWCVRGRYRRLYARLGARSRRAAVERAISLGLINPV